MHSTSPPSGRLLPDAYRDAVYRFASAARLDADALQEGQGFDFGGVRFRLECYAQMDPDGLYLLVEVGQFEQGSAGSVCQRLLELNMLVPAARLGYYGVMPGSNMVMYCMRIDLSQTAEAHELIAAAAQALTHELQRTLSELAQAAKKAAGTGINPDIA